jgi:hypothetical protein
MPHTIRGRDIDTNPTHRSPSPDLLRVLTGSEVEQGL